VKVAQKLEDIKNNQEEELLKLESLRGEVMKQDKILSEKSKVTDDIKEEIVEGNVELDQLMAGKVGIEKEIKKLLSELDKTKKDFSDWGILILTAFCS